MITYKVQRVTDPAVEPISLARAKEQLRLEPDFTLDDDLIGSYISAARDQAEKYCNRSFALADFVLLCGRFPAGRQPLQLPDPLTTNVSSLTYIDDQGDEQTIDPSDYTVDFTRQEIRPTDFWPVPASSVLIGYSAGPDGSASPSEEPPQSVIQGMLLLITDMYENREAQFVGTIAADNPAAALRLHLHRVEMGV